MRGYLGTVSCPKCKTYCVLPAQGPEHLSTNMYVLNNIEMKNMMKNQQ